MGSIAAIRLQPLRRATKILLAEDDADLRALYELILGSLGWQVEAVADGQEAWRAIDAKPHDYACVVTDFLMPYVDGGQLVQYIRSNDKTAELPVLMVTALPVTDPRIRALAGQCEVLSKDRAITPAQVSQALTALGVQPSSTESSDLATELRAG